MQRETDGKLTILDLAAAIKLRWMTCDTEIMKTNAGHRGQKNLVCM